MSEIYAVNMRVIPLDEDGKPLDEDGGMIYSVDGNKITFHKVGTYNLGTITVSAGTEGEHIRFHDKEGEAAPVERTNTTSAIIPDNIRTRMHTGGHGLPEVYVTHNLGANVAAIVSRTSGRHGGNVDVMIDGENFAGSIVAERNELSGLVTQKDVQLQLADELVAQRERQRDEANESVRILAHAMTEVANRLETVRGTAGQLDEFRPLVHKLRETMNACTTEAQRSGGTFVAVDPASPHSDGAVVTGVRHPDGKVTITSATAGTAPRVGRCEHRSHEHNDTDGGGCSKCSCPRSYGEVVAQGMCGPPEDHHTADNHRCRCGKLEKQDSPGCFWHHGDDGSYTSAAECATEGGCKLGDARPVAAEAAPWSLRRWAFVAKGTMEAQAANLEEARSLAARLDGWRTSPSGRLIAHTVEMLSTMASNYPDDEEAMRREVEEAQANHYAVIDLTRTMREAAAKIDSLGMSPYAALDDIARTLLAEADAWSDTKGPEPEGEEAGGPGEREELLRLISERGVEGLDADELADDVTQLLRPDGPGCWPEDEVQGDLNGDYLANVQAARGPIAFQAPGWSAPAEPTETEALQQPREGTPLIQQFAEVVAVLEDAARAMRAVQVRLSPGDQARLGLSLARIQKLLSGTQGLRGDAELMPRLPDHLLHGLQGLSALLDRNRGRLTGEDGLKLIGYRSYLRWVIGEGQ